MTDMTKATRPDLSITLRRAVLIALPIFVVVLIWALNARVAPVDPTKGIPPDGKLPFWVTAIASSLVALAVGMLLSLAISNFKRWRVVLHPNRGRILGTVILSFLTPLTIFSYIPWLLGTTLLYFISVLDMGLTFISFLSLLLWYPVSCLLVSGVGHRRLRFALFCLTWWGAYSAVLLYHGYQVFRI